MWQDWHLNWHSRVASRLTTALATAVKLAGERFEVVFRAAVIGVRPCQYGLSPTAVACPAAVASRYLDVVTQVTGSPSG